MQGFANLLYTPVLIQLKNGTTQSQNIADVSKIYFKDVATAIDENGDSNTANIRLYPNPTSNLIFIENIANDDKMDIKIYRLDGSMVSNNKISTINPSIDVSHLSNGMYIFKINHQVLKFIKQ